MTTSTGLGWLRSNTGTASRIFLSAEYHILPPLSSRLFSSSLGRRFLFAPPCVHTLGRLHTQTSARRADAPLPRDPGSVLPNFLVPEARSFLPRACPLGQPTWHVFARLMHLCPKIISFLSCWLFFSFQ